MTEDRLTDTDLPADEDEMLEEEELGGSEDKFLAGVAKLMPWVISLLFHVGLFLIMLFLVMIVFVDETPEEVIIPDAVLSENMGSVSNPSASQTKTKSTTSKRNLTKKTKVSADAGKTDKALDIIGGGGGSGGSRSMGMGTAGSGGGTKGKFFGTGGNAHNVVYVIDRSGSMVETFQAVKMEMLRSIGLLKPSQSFHIILFAEGKPIEPKNRNLKRATFENKMAANDFLSDKEAHGLTSPVRAINRAFAVLSQARRPGRLMYLLTDAGFDEDTPAVLSTISERNSVLSGNKKVLINTFLYGSKEEMAVEAMKKIADENGGKYRFIPID
jgi:hypothetical protein